MIVVDTNVLIYAADADSPWHAASRSWLDQRRRRPDAWYTTWPILYEFLRVVTHPRVMRQPWTLAEAWRFAAVLLESPGLTVLTPGEQHVEIAAEVVHMLPHLCGNIIHDVHTAILMREHGVARICTRDADFHRFPFVEVVDPAAAI